MSAEGWAVFLALWRVADRDGRRHLVLWAGQAQLLWECVCQVTEAATDLHPWSTPRCGRCQRARR